MDEIKELKRRLETKRASGSYAECAYKEEEVTISIALENKLAIYSEEVADSKSYTLQKGMLFLASRQLRRVSEERAKCIIEWKKHRSESLKKRKEGVQG